MRFKIYKIVQPDFLQNTIPDGYYVKIIERVVLQTPDYDSCLYGDHASVMEANQIIFENKEKLKGEELCILPIVKVGYNGEIE